MKWLKKKHMSVPSGNTFPVLTIERGSMIFFGSKNAHSFKKSIANSPSKKWYQKKSIVNLAETILLQRAIRLVRDHSSITSSKRWVGGVRKWQFLIIYNTVNHQRVGWVGLKKSRTWWRNTWMVPKLAYGHDVCLVTSMQ